MAGDGDPYEWADADEWSIPPPPPPPSFCTGGPGVDSPFLCRAGEGGPMGAHFDRAAAFPSMPVVAVCSSVVFVAVLVASFLFWRHKSKVQNLLPCKSEVVSQGCHHGGERGAANGVTYEDILAGHHRMQGSQTLMPLEILDVKLGDMSPSQIPSLHHPPLYPSSRTKKPFHHPVYEEVAADKSADKLGNHTSEEEFDGSGGQCSATSSVRGSTGGDLCRDPVSSDEGESYLPKIVPGDNTFGYPRRQNSDTTYPAPMQNAQRDTTYPQRDFIRTHSNQMDSSRHVVSPSHQRQNVVSPSHMRPNVVPDNNVRHVRPFHHGQRAPVDPRSMAQWHGGQDVGYPASENIYSTIDEDDDYPPTSLAKGPARGGDGRPPPLSQRNPDENGSSYGDIMPAFHSASFM